MSLPERMADYCELLREQQAKAQQDQRPTKRPYTNPKLDRLADKLTRLDPW